MFSNSALDRSLHILGDERVLTVSELSVAIKKQLEGNFASIRIHGEVSGLKKHSSGHTYLFLKDNDSTIKAICWMGTKLGFQLEDGMDIVVSGRVTTYKEQSQYEFIIKEAHLAGEGALLKLLNERKKHFESLGYFDKSKKKPIPKFPKIIGIVTSKTGSVLQDMRHRLEDRYPFCLVRVWSVNVQGAGSAEQISNAIRGFNFMTDWRPDVLIVARGGGSIEDLWSFNEEIVIKAVFDSKIPVISAIGHETDFPLIDYVSDLRAPTPTAAIELATPVLSEIRLQLSKYSEKMQTSIVRLVKEGASRVVLAKKCLSSSQFAIIAIIQKFDDGVDRLLIAIANFFQREHLKLLSKRILSLENYVLLKKQRYTAASNTVKKLTSTYLARYLDKFESLFNRLEQASFKKILEKGFCFITSCDGKTVRTKEQFTKTAGSRRLIHFQDGPVEI
ncbi:MAG: exodeoxyribonuclease VII large subunit [Holosporales bacterium]|jgi:exodeoxyribonuclease VII large subunit|nr:exodeoxyribonuclease VII large subunit [Holosporales bacterium]